jgi:hypothetical protein
MTLDLNEIINKIIIATVVTLALGLVILVAWHEYPIRDSEFGYYGEFNIAKHAIEKSGCAEKIEYSYVNKDVVLEEFEFRVTTRSGRAVRLWFDASNMDVSQVCYSPVGFSVTHSANRVSRRYSPERVSELLKDRGIQIKDLKDFLCNIDQLEEVFRTAPGDAKALRESDPYVWDYLQIKFLTEEELKVDEYTDVKEKDVMDWP